MGTQDTNIASTQEQLRPPVIDRPRPLSCSQESYGLTSSLEAGLQISFDHQTMVSTQSSGIISSLPSDVAQEALRRVTNLETQSRAQDQGLARIWRMLFLLPRRVCNTVLILIYCSIVPLLAPRRTLSHYMGGSKDWPQLWRRLIIN